MSRPSQEVHSLPAQRVLTLQVTHRHQLAVQTGRLWLTQPNDPTDHFLDAGQSLALRPGRVVIQAEQDCVYALHCAWVS
jgi:hypothetical protein